MPEKLIKKNPLPAKKGVFYIQAAAGRRIAQPGFRSV
jgi:hypothetical protein